MKIALLLALTFTSTAAYSAGKEMPNGATCASGWICTPPGTAKKKVAHKSKPKPKADPAKVECALEKPAVVINTIQEKRVSQKNHLRLYGGGGPGSISRFDTSTTITLHQDYGLVLGLGYGRNISERWSLEGVAATNGTVLLGIGYGW